MKDKMVRVFTKYDQVPMNILVSVEVPFIDLLFGKRGCWNTAVYTFDSEVIGLEGVRFITYKLLKILERRRTI